MQPIGPGMHSPFHELPLAPIRPRHYSICSSKGHLHTKWPEKEIKHIPTDNVRLFRSQLSRPHPRLYHLFPSPPGQTSHIPPAIRLVSLLRSPEYLPATTQNPTRHSISSQKSHYRHLLVDDYSRKTAASYLGFQV